MFIPYILCLYHLYYVYTIYNIFSLYIDTIWTFFTGLILIANVCLANFVPMQVTKVNQLVNHFLSKSPQQQELEWSTDVQLFIEVISTGMILYCCFINYLLLQLICWLPGIDYSSSFLIIYITIFEIYNICHKEHLC